MVYTVMINVSARNRQIVVNKLPENFMEYEGAIFFMISHKGFTDMTMLSEVIQELIDTEQPYLYNGITISINKNRDISLSDGFSSSSLLSIRLQDNIKTASNTILKLRKDTDSFGMSENKIVVTPEITRSRKNVKYRSDREYMLYRNCYGNSGWPLTHAEYVKFCADRNMEAYGQL